MSGEMFGRNVQLELRLSRQVAPTGVCLPTTQRIILADVMGVPHGGAAVQAIHKGSGKCWKAVMDGITEPKLCEQVSTA